MRLDQIRAESRDVAEKIDNLRAVESDDAAVIEQRDADLAGLMSRAEELEAAADKAAKVAEARQKLDAIVNRCSALDAPVTREVREIEKPRPVQYHGRLRHFNDAEAAYRCGQFISGYVLGNSSAREWCEIAQMTSDQRRPVTPRRFSRSSSRCSRREPSTSAGEALSLTSGFCCASRAGH